MLVYYNQTEDFVVFLVVKCLRDKEKYSLFLYFSFSFSYPQLP